MGTITVTNNNDSGAGFLRNTVAAAQDEPTEYFHGSSGVLTTAQITFSGAGERDILTGGDYSEVSSSGIINTGNNADSITASIDQGIGTNFIIGGTANDSLVGDGQDQNNIFGGERLDTLIWGDSEPSPETGKKLKQLRPLGTQFHDTRDDELSSDQFNGFPGLSIVGDSSSGNGSSKSDGADTLLASDFDGNGSSGSDGTSTLYGGIDDFLNGNNQILIIEPPTDQLFSVGVGSVETAIFLPVVIPARERAAHFSGASSSDEAWAALGNISQLTSGEMTLPSLPGEFDQIKVKKLPWSD
jgi:hypothetical protein